MPEITFERVNYRTGQRTTYELVGSHTSTRRVGTEATQAEGCKGCRGAAFAGVRP